MGNENLNEVEKLQKKLEKLETELQEALGPHREWCAKVDAIKTEMKSIRDQQEKLVKQFLGSIQV